MRSAVVETLRQAVVACTVATGLGTTVACATTASPTDQAPAVAPSHYRIAYRVAMSEPASHLYDVQIAIGGLGRDTVKLQLPVWSPGRYARVDFARNVQDFSVTDAAGTPLVWDQQNGSVWRVLPNATHQLRLHYRVYANTLSGTYSVLDTAHANWNGAGLFMYVLGHKPDPVQLTIVPPAGWHIINGDAVQPDQTEYTFENYDRLIDTPTEVAPSIAVDSFTVDGRLYRTAVHHNGPFTQAQRARFVRSVQQLVTTENRVIAPPPLKMYTFLFNIGYKGGDGMEHLYSTQIIDSHPWTDTATLLPGVTTAAHEYFHTWNVKRIRPIALGPFDYTTEQYEPSLWVAEGWTQYHGDMSLTRSGVADKTRLYRTLAGVIRYNNESPGRKEMSARQSSFRAPFFDGGVQPMETNQRNTVISYYYKGEALAWLLDLKIRAATNDTKSIGDVLRLLKSRTWDVPNASYYLQGRGYTEADVEQAASDVYGQNLHDWFNHYVGGKDDLPWDQTLALAGLRVVVSNGASGRTYTLEETSDATPAQRRVREGWLAGPAAGRAQ